MKSPGSSPEFPLPPPSMEQEVEEGKIEYKLRLDSASDERQVNLVTQMKWRLREGSGSCVYYLGMRDDGFPVGLPLTMAVTSLSVLRTMAAAAGAEVWRVQWHAAAGEPSPRRVIQVEIKRRAGSGSGGGSDWAATAQGESNSPSNPSPLGEGGGGGGGGGGEGAGASPTYPSSSSSSSSSPSSSPGLAPPASATFPVEPRVALLGAKGSGKSTLVAALSQGILDDGRGSARSAVVRHRHELEEGATSSAISCWTVGLDSSGALVAPSVYDNVSVVSAGSEGHDLLSFRGVGPSEGSIHSIAARTVALLDLPGARKYFKSLLSGLLGGVPDAALLLVDGSDPGLVQQQGQQEQGHCGSSSAPLLTPTLQPATLAHAQLLAALSIPFAIVVTHSDSAALLQQGGSQCWGARRRGDIAALLPPIPPHLSLSPHPLFVSCVSGEGLPDLGTLLLSVRSRMVGVGGEREGGGGGGGGGGVNGRVGLGRRGMMDAPLCDSPPSPPKGEGGAGSGGFSGGGGEVVEGGGEALRLHRIKEPSPLSPSPPASILRVLDTWEVGGQLVVGGLCIEGVLEEGCKCFIVGVGGSGGGGGDHPSSTSGASAGGESAPPPPPLTLLPFTTLGSVHVRGGAAPGGKLSTGDLGSISLGPTSRLPEGVRRAIRRGCLIVRGGHHMGGVRERKEEEGEGEGEDEDEGDGAHPSLPFPSMGPALFSPCRRPLFSVLAPGPGSAVGGGKWREGSTAILITCTGMKVSVLLSKVCLGGAVGEVGGWEEGGGGGGGGRASSPSPAVGGGELESPRGAASRRRRGYSTSLTDGAQGTTITLELPRYEYVEIGRAVLWDGGTGWLVLESGS